MRPLVVRARLLLVMGEDGRTTPIRSGDHQDVDCGATWSGAPVLTTARVHLLDREHLAPGDEADVRIEPVWPELWHHVRPGTVLTIHENSREVGHATVTEVARSELFALAIADFVWRAREFCRFIEDAPKMGSSARLAGARARLLDLYAAAVALPDADSEGHEERDAPPAPEGWPSFDEYECYWEVFDPYEPEEEARAPVVGSLSDDLLDVYRDVQRGLWNWDRGAWAGAVWTWRFTFETHWGDHAVDALRALHRACVRQGG